MSRFALRLSKLGKEQLQSLLHNEVILVRSVPLEEGLLSLVEPAAPELTAWGTPIKLRGAGPLRPIIGAYQHFRRAGVIWVLSFAGQDEKTGEQQVVYYHDGKLWARDIGVFFSRIHRGVRRFAPMTQETADTEREYRELFGRR